MIIIEIALTHFAGRVLPLSNSLSLAPRVVAIALSRIVRLVKQPVPNTRVKQEFWRRK